MSVKYSAIRDDRVIDYLPVQRAVTAHLVDEPQFFNGRTVTQPSEIQRPGDALVLKNGAFIVLDFGMELTGGVRIVTGKTGGKIRLVFGESVSEALAAPESWHTIHDQILELPGMGATEFGNTGFRFVRIEALCDDLPLTGVMAVYRHLDLMKLGKFECSDERLQQIWDVSCHTVSLNMQDYILDGVKRDRLVWMGDMHTEISVINLVYGAHPLVKKSLDFIRDRYPLPEYMNNISSYSIWWVICHYDLFMHFADLDYLKEQHEYLTGLMIQLAELVAPDGREMMPGFRFIDWPTRGDDAAVHAGLQGLMARGFFSAQKLAEFLGDKKLADLCRKKLALLRSYTPGATHRKAPNALLVLGGIGDPVQVNDKVLSVDPCDDLGTFMGFYTLNARALAKDYDGVLNTIRKYYGAMLDYGATSFWEDFDLKWVENAKPIDQVPEAGFTDIHADCGAYCYKSLRHSLCHGWAGGPAALLLQMLGGIRIVEPGFKAVCLTPAECQLEFFRCAVPTPLGTLEVEKKRGCEPRFSLPRGMKLVLPD